MDEKEKKYQRGKRKKERRVPMIRMSNPAMLISQRDFDIENQFGASDHDHLGKLITYSAVFHGVIVGAIVLVMLLLS